MVEKRILASLKDQAYEGPVTPVRRKQKVTDEDLLAVFETLKGKWFDVGVLEQSIGSIIPVNASNPKRSAFSSGYLKRLSRMTGMRWRQKSGLGEGGKRLVKVYTQPLRK